MTRKNYVGGKIEKGAFTALLPQFDASSVRIKDISTIAKVSHRKPHGVSAAAREIVGTDIFISAGKIVCTTNDAARRVARLGARLLGTSYKLALYQS